MKYGSVCSGIEAASVAWEPLGWQPVFFSEIEPFPSAVLAYHWPSVPNLGDFTQIDIKSHDIDLLVGGTPCQAFSIAGARGGLDDARGNLTLEFVKLIHASQSLRYVVWENVPGVLSDDTNAFGCFLSGLVGGDAPLHTPGGARWPDSGMVAGPRGRAAWRILDAQYFGLAQRRRRVFLVFCPAAYGRDPAAILFEPKGMFGDSPPSREAGQGIAPTLSARTKGGGGLGTDFDLDGGLIEVAYAIQGSMIGRGDAAGPQGSGYGDDETMFTLTKGDQHAVAVAFALRGREGGAQAEVGGDVSNALRTPGGGASVPMVATRYAVRRLTPIECARLQGFPDGHTDAPWRRKNQTPDGPQYKAYGNSMATNVMRWIGERIQAHEDTYEDHV